MLYDKHGHARKGQHSETYVAWRRIHLGYFEVEQEAASAIEVFFSDKPQRKAVNL